MRVDELDFEYPENLVATERAAKSRVLITREPFQFQELGGGLRELTEFFEKGDVLVINDTKVLSRRIFSEEGLEILFLAPLSLTESSATEPNGPSFAPRRDGKTGRHRHCRAE